MRVWHKGRICDESEVRVPLSDPVFEHGLGLFETLRSWNYRVPLLDRHLARMSQSAMKLGLTPVLEDDLPTERDLGELLQAEGRPDSLIRITRTAGSDQNAPAIWVRSSSLPPAPPAAGLTLVAPPWKVDPFDRLAQHKSLNYWQRRLAFEFAKSQGGDEALLVDRSGHPWEGSRTNLFVVIRDRLISPPLAGPIVPGIMRLLVLESATDLKIEVEERILGRDDMQSADAIFMTNSVRMILPVKRVVGWFEPPADPPLEMARRIEKQVRERLEITSDLAE